MEAATRRRDAASARGRVGMGPAVVARAKRWPLRANMEPRARALHVQRVVQRVRGPDRCMLGMVQESRVSPGLNDQESCTDGNIDL